MPLGTVELPGGVRECGRGGASAEYNQPPPGRVVGHGGAAQGDRGVARLSSPVDGPAVLGAGDGDAAQEAGHCNDPDGHSHRPSPGIGRSNLLSDWPSRWMVGGCGQLVQKGQRPGGHEPNPGVELISLGRGLTASRRRACPPPRRVQSRGGTSSRGPRQRGSGSAGSLDPPGTQCGTPHPPSDTQVSKIASGVRATHRGCWIGNQTGHRWTGARATRIATY